MAKYRQLSELFNFMATQLIQRRDALKLPLRKGNRGKFSESETNIGLLQIERWFMLASG
jgi:hypothetical protein